MENIKVIFKKERNPYTKSWDVFAVFPDFTAKYGYVQAYTTEGWCEVSYEYYATAKRAYHSEYAEMLRYLTKELEEDGLRLIIGQRISWKNKAKMWLESADSMHI